MQVLVVPPAAMSVQLQSGVSPGSSPSVSTGLTEPTKPTGAVAVNVTAAAGSGPRFSIL